MQKQEADRLILDYNKKLFGFALSKTANVGQAEELAARITLEVYAALLTREIANPAGYIYRIAQNVFARFLEEEKHTGYSLDGMAELPEEADFTEALAEGETYRRLRLEIAFLSRTQREIVVAHYYGRQKLSDIAERLRLPVGTVKWHLYDARNNLKEGLHTVKNYEIGELGVRPIELVVMGHSGSPGSMGDTQDFLKRRLTQNVAYAAYWQPKTVPEIAAELGVSPIFVEDEVAVLEEYGFLDKIGEKYRANIYITEPSRETEEAEHRLYQKCAAILREQYVPLVLDSLREMDMTRFYIPDGDQNLLNWVMITYACSNKLAVDKPGSDNSRFKVKRKDGGDYMAFAALNTGYAVSFDRTKYGACGDMTRNIEPDSRWCAWQLNTVFDERPGGWRDNRAEDYQLLYRLMTGKLPKDEEHVEGYRRLYDKGYLRPDDTVNLIVMRNEPGTWYNWLNAQLPGLTDELRAVGDEMDTEMYALRKDRYPEHMHGLCRAESANCFVRARTRLLEQLVEHGALTLPTERQKAGLNTLMMCDVLPK